MTDLSKWPTEPDAASAIGVSVRTLQRYAESGKIEIRPRPREGKKPENVCNPRDVDRLLPAAHVMPEDDGKQNDAIVRTHSNGNLPVAQKFTADTFFAFIATITTAIATRQNDAIAAPAPKLWLSLDEAAEYAALSRGYLMGLIDTEKIAAVKGGPHGAWRIQRASLEAFEG